MTTIGVAIPVPEPYGSELRERRAGFGDPLAETVPTHVTLIPPVEVREDELDDVCAALGRVSGEVAPYAMRLHGTGTFRPVSPVVFVAVTEGVADTGDLADRVRRALAVPEPEFPFHPHVTVAHHLEEAMLDRAHGELSGFACDFAVDHFALYHHEDGAGWVPQKAFLLGP
jgi:2'-5' RNA ligase